MKKDVCTFTLRLPTELKIQLDILATKENRSTNNLIMTMLQENIEQRRKK